MSNKTFSTITLRNLDSAENTDVVEILNDYMKETGVKTGQSAIEGIIRKYYKLLKLSRELQAAKNQLEKDLAQAKQDWEAENKAFTKTLNTFSIFTEDLSAFKNGIGALQELQKSRSPVQTNPFSAFTREYRYPESNHNFKKHSEEEEEYDDEEEEEWEEEEFEDEEED